MSKLAIILCVVIFASAANASFGSDAFKSLQKRIDGIVTAAINEVKSRFDAAKQKAIESLAKLEKAVREFGEKVSKEVSAILEKIRIQVDKIIGQANGANVTECTDLFKELESAAASLSLNISGCAADKVSTGVGYLESMTKVTDNVIDSLQELKEEGLRCGDGVVGIRTTIQALFCSKMVVVKATWAASKAIPSVTTNLVKFTYLLTTLTPSLSYCTATNALVVLSHQSSSVVKKIEQCVKEKIKQAGSGGAKNPQSIPDVSPDDKATVVISKSAISTIEAVQQSTETAQQSTETVQPSTETAPIVE